MSFLMPVTAQPVGQKVVSYMDRRPDWQGRLSKYIVQSRDASIMLDWENFHCMSWALGAIYQVVDHNLNLLYDDASIKTAEDAAKAIRDAGFKNMDEAVEAYLEPVAMPFVQRGDLVLVNPEPGTYPSEYMPHALAIAEPPVYWALNDFGVGMGDLFKDGYKAFAVGRRV